MIYMKNVSICVKLKFYFLSSRVAAQQRSSSVPMDALPVFPLMPNLEELDLRGCLISDIEPGVFNNLPKLKSLLLSTNLFDSFSNFLTGTTKLSHLAYRQTIISSIVINKSTGQMIVILLSRILDQMTCFALMPYLYFIWEGVQVLFYQVSDNQNIFG